MQPDDPEEGLCWEVPVPSTRGGTEPTTEAGEMSELVVVCVVYVCVSMRACVFLVCFCVFCVFLSLSVCVYACACVCVRACVRARGCDTPKQAQEKDTENRRPIQLTRNPRESAQGCATATSHQPLSKRGAPTTLGLTCWRGGTQQHYVPS